MELPYLQPWREVSQKEFWINAYLAALHRVDSEQAKKEADAALEACNSRWDSRLYPPIESCQYAHNYPLGVLPRSTAD